MAVDAVADPQITNSTNPGSTGRSTPDGETTGFAHFLEQYGLAAAAICAWLFLFIAFAVDRLTDSPHWMVVALYVGSYLAGGTMATRSAIEDLFKRTVNIDLLMVLAASGAAVIGARTLRDIERTGVLRPPPHP